MNKFTLDVPKNIEYFSEWTDFMSLLPSNKVIVNKVICGCGITHSFLSALYPVLLVSPRIGLINCKMKDPFLTNLFYYDRSEPDKVKTQETEKQLRDYLSNQYYKNGTMPRVLVTYDSLPSVMSILRDMGLLHIFTIIVDEFTCIFTDARLKGQTELKLLTELVNIPNRCLFISATPIHDVYLEQMKEFQCMDYVTLNWDESKRIPIEVVSLPMKSSITSICEVINLYRKRHYFRSEIVDDEIVYSREAVFFVNSVSVITRVINKLGLTPQETRIICADRKENRDKLPKGFEISEFPERYSYKTENKTITFVTCTAYEGADLYSDDASIYIMADANIESLNVDVMIDLPQIIGRCRTMSNPFRYKVYLYRKTIGKGVASEEEAKNEVDERRCRTVDFINNCGDLSYGPLLEKVSMAQKKEKYNKDYVDVLKDGAGNSSIVFNQLVWLADMRAIHIKYYQYKNNESLHLYLRDNGFNPFQISDINGPYDDFFSNLFILSTFEKRLEFCFNEMDKNPGIGIYIFNHPDIPDDVKDCLGYFTHDECRSVSYKKADLKRIKLFRDLKPEIINYLRGIIVPGKIYPKQELKEIIQSIYDSMGITTPKAKASDIMEFFDNVEEKGYKDANNNKQYGFKIQ